jgi:hypothetical protein
MLAPSREALMRSRDALIATKAKMSVALPQH